MSQVMKKVGYLFLTARQVKLLGQGKYIRIRRNGEHTTIKMQNKDTKQRKLENKIRTLKLKLKELKGAK